MDHLHGMQGPYALAHTPSGARLRSGVDAAGRAVVLKRASDAEVAVYQRLAGVEGVLPLHDQLRRDGRPVLVFLRLEEDLGPWLYGGPDPGWDPFSLAEMLFVGLTGQLPACVEDPRPLLTARGRSLWALAQRVEQAGPETVGEAFAHFEEARGEVEVGEVPAASGGLGPADREALRAGLAGLDGPRRRRALLALLAPVLDRALRSDPAERHGDPLRLAETLAQARSLVAPARPKRILGGVEPRTPEATPVSGAPSSMTSLAMWGVATLMTAGLVAQMPSYGDYFLSLQEEVVEVPDRIEVPGGIEIIGGEMEVLVRPFLIDRVEKTNADWRACQFAGACRMRLLKGEDDHPVVGLQLDDAKALCDYFGGRVPRRSEWTRVVGSATYPWGDQVPNCDLAVYKSCGRGLQPVGSRTEGKSPYGLADLAGNAAEWVTGDNPSDTPWLMGGNANADDWELANAAGKPFRGKFSTAMAGARCVYEIR